MGKKKKKNISFLKEVDKNLNHSYDSLKEEIEILQRRIEMADAKARKKAKKLMKKKDVSPHQIEYIRKSARTEIINEMKSSNFLERVEEALKCVAPIIILIARLVAALICAILSIDSVKVFIGPEMLKKIDNLYNKCMSVTKIKA